jgi:hypothetical protein
MPLNFSLDQIQNFESLCWIDEGTTQRISPVTEALIFHTMAVGIPRVTDKNVDEFVLRVTGTEALVGVSLWRVNNEGATVPRPLTPTEIRAHVGLATNASAFSHTEWKRRVNEMVARRAV